MGLGLLWVSVASLRGRSAAEKPHEPAQEIDDSHYLAPIKTEAAENVEETAPFSGFAISVDTEPTGVADLTPLEEVTLDRARVRTSLDEPASGRYLVVWLTELPAVDGGFRGEIAEIVVSE